MSHGPSLNLYAHEGYDMVEFEWTMSLMLDHQSGSSRS